MLQRITVAVVLAGLWAGNLEAATDFSFVIPAGWTDLSPAAPAANFKRLADEVVREAMSDRYLAYAVDRPAGRDDVAASLRDSSSFVYSGG